MNNSRYALKITNLTKTYSNGVKALNGIDLEIKEGDFFAFLGENGAGKSTTIGIVTSLVTKTSGKVEVFGYDLDNEQNQVKNCIGVVPQEINLNIFEKCLDILVWQGGYYGMSRSLSEARAEELLKQLDLWEKRAEPSKNLSGGMKRRLMIARALMHNPKLLILDEPSAGVDVAVRKGMWDYLKKLNKDGTTILLTTHYIEEAEELCNNVAMISKGSILRSGNIRDLLSEQESEEFIIEIQNPVTSSPNLTGFKTHLIDSQTLKVEIKTGKSINDLVTKLSQHSIIVTGIRQNENRLEKLFLKVITN